MIYYIHWQNVRGSFKKMSTVRHFDSPTPLLIMFRKQEYLEIRMCKVVQYDMHSMSLEIWRRHHCLIFTVVVVVVVNCCCFLLLLLLLCLLLLSSSLLLLLLLFICCCNTLGSTCRSGFPLTGTEIIRSIGSRH